MGCLNLMNACLLDMHHLTGSLGFPLRAFSDGLKLGGVAERI